MKIILPLAVALIMPVRAQTVEPGRQDVLAWLQAVVSELRELRRELLEDRLERQEARVRALEGESRRVRAERLQAEALQHRQNLELVRVDERLRDPDLGPDTRSQLETLRTEFTRGASDRTDFAHLESLAGEKLNREQLRLEKLLELARTLATQERKTNQSITVSLESLP
jgi:hypothetical protein